ncbi:MAG: hypothetical protein AB4080_15150 [Trichodesmium sp.]
MTSNFHQKNCSGYFYTAPKFERDKNGALDGKSGDCEEMERWIH